MSNFERDGTSSALLEQLVYIDNFMTNTSEGTPNLDVDGQLSLDLAAFADDSFIFPDADKPKRDKDDFDHFEVNNNSNNNDNNNGNHNNSNNNGILNSGINANNINNANGHNNDLGLGLGGDNSGNNLHSDLTNLINKTSPVEFNAQFQQQQQQQYQKLTLNISELPKVPVPPGAQSSLVAAGLSQNQIDLLAALVAQHQQSDPKSQQSSPSVAATPMATTNSAVRQHNQITNLQELHQIRFEEESQSASPQTLRLRLAQQE